MANLFQKELEDQANEKKKLEQTLSASLCSVNQSDQPPRQVSIASELTAWKQHEIPYMDDHSNRSSTKYSKSNMYHGPISKQSPRLSFRKDSKNVGFLFNLFAGHFETY